MNRILTVAIIGCGSRGCGAYGGNMMKLKEMFQIVALCDVNSKMLKLAKDRLHVPDENTFVSEEEFFKKKRADILVVATQDRQHVRMCIKGFYLGYTVLLEKPITPVKQELYELLEAQKKTHGKALVCHVLRYAPTALKIKEVLDSGIIGKLIMMESIEQVAYWHQAHAFVRGNWRNEDETSPMILAKCCHDMDLIQYYAGSCCDTVYSSGGLSFFNKKNQPKDAADRCAECKYINECVYSAENLYIEKWKTAGCPADMWPQDVVQPVLPLSEDSLRKAYREGPYGRCVFACDNNVVDNQTLIMNFKNGVRATHVMTAFTNFGGRKEIFHGTLGEIEYNGSLGDERTGGLLRVSVFGGETKYYTDKELILEGHDEFGHGGGDYGIMFNLYNLAAGKADATTSLEESVESHLMALAAEESRKSGEVCKVHQ